MNWLIVIKWLSYVAILISALSLQGDRSYTWEYFIISIGTMIYGLCWAIQK